VLWQPLQHRLEGILPVFGWLIVVGLVLQPVGDVLKQLVLADVAERTQIITMLCEGSSMRSISRVADVSINTVSTLRVEAGEACLAIHEETVRNVNASRIHCDEIWSFCYAKGKTAKLLKDKPEGAGDVWTWTALDADTKLIVSFYFGDRSGASAIELMDDLRDRLANRVQLTTDGHKAYLEAVSCDARNAADGEGFTLRASTPLSKSRLAGGGDDQERTVFQLPSINLDR
jgi:IS1 family transposase